MRVRIASKLAAVLILAASGRAWTAPRSGQTHAIDTRSSVLTVRVFKAGVLSAFGHEHTIAAPITSGTVDSDARRVEVRVAAGALRVRDGKISDKDRDEIQKHMLGPEVLDAGRYAEIVFRSTAAEPAGANAWSLRGNLTLHGQTRPVTVEVSQKGGRYVGESRFKQTEFGIRPIRVAGGGIRVKDEVEIQFDIQLER